MRVISIFRCCRPEREKLQGTLDLAVATMWNTAEFVEQSSKIRKKKYLVQNFEVGFYPPGKPVPDRNFGDLPDEELRWST